MYVPLNVKGEIIINIVLDYLLKSYIKSYLEKHTINYTTQIFKYCLFLILKLIPRRLVWTSVKRVIHRVVWVVKIMLGG